MSVIGWIQILLFCAIIAAVTPVLGAYLTRVFNGQRTFLSPVLRPVELCFTGLQESKRRANKVGLHDRNAAVSRRRFRDTLCVDAHARASCRSIPRGNRLLRLICRSTPPSVSSPIPTGKTTAAKRTMSYLVQMLGLTHQNFLSAATGIVLAIALIRGFARTSAKTVGNFWVDIRAVRSTCCCRSAYHMHCSWFGRVCRRHSVHMSMQRHSKAAGRQLRSVLLPRKLPSRCSGPTAAASSMPMRHTHLKTRQPCRISCRSSRSSRSVPPSPMCSAA